MVVLASYAAKPEPTSFAVRNPGRVTYNQQPLCRLDAAQRWQPIRKDATKYFGVLMLRDTAPTDADVDLVKLKGPEDGACEWFGWRVVGYRPQRLSCCCAGFM